MKERLEAFSPAPSDVREHLEAFAQRLAKTSLKHEKIDPNCSATPMTTIMSSEALSLLLPLLLLILYKLLSVSRSKAPPPKAAWEYQGEP